MRERREEVSEGEREKGERGREGDRRDERGWARK